MIEPARTNAPPSLPYERRFDGKVIGYTGEFGPGRQSVLIGALALAIQVVATLCWKTSPIVSLWLIVIFNYLIPIVYVLLLPMTIFGFVRATTAFRLRIESHARWAGVLLNAAALACWMYPIVWLGL